MKQAFPFHYTNLWLSIAEWIMTLCLLILGVEFIRPHIGNALMMLYQYFVQGIGMNRQ